MKRSLRAVLKGRCSWDRLEGAVDVGITQEIFALTLHEAGEELRYCRDSGAIDYRKPEEHVTEVVERPRRKRRAPAEYCIVER